MSTAPMLPAAGPDENHLNHLPDAHFLLGHHPSVPTEKITTTSLHSKQDRVCAMAKLYAKMQLMNMRMAKAHSLKAHARDLAAYYKEMRAIQSDLIRAEIELQQDLAAEGFPDNYHGHHHGHHHPKRAFADETNHPDEVNHIVHDELHDAEHFYQHRDVLDAEHMFEDVELPSLSGDTWLGRAGQLRENHHHHHDVHTGAPASCPAQAHQAAIKQHGLAHQSVIPVATATMMPRATSLSHATATAVASGQPPTVVAATAPGPVYPAHADAQEHAQQGAKKHADAQEHAQQGAKKRRKVKRQPTRPSHTPWTTAESEAFKKLVADEGPSKWESKAATLKLAFGTARTAKALHTRWMRDQGRIIDRPRITGKKSKNRVRKQDKNKDKVEDIKVERATPPRAPPPTSAPPIPAPSNSATPAPSVPGPHAAPHVAENAPQQSWKPTDTDVKSSSGAAAAHVALPHSG